jgi:uncharacterized membrane protein YbhN (UPF0104 family)
VIGRLGSILRLPLIRMAFVLIALLAALFAVSQREAEVRAAVTDIPARDVALSSLLGLLFVVLSMFVWRSLLHDMGSKVSLRSAANMFLVSQLGKYLPGGLWNIVAIAEVGADYKIPRRRSVSAMMVATLVSVVTGLALAVLSIPLAPGAVTGRYGGAAIWALPLFAVVLAPPVLNQLLGAALRVLRRPPLEHPVTARGVMVAVAWSILAWLCAGGHVWTLATGIGLEPSVKTLALATGGYALAWILGFVVVVTPAGVGIREVVLGAVLASQLGAGAVVAVVLLSRVILTVSDLFLGLAALAAGRGSRNGPAAG